MSYVVCRASENSPEPKVHATSYILPTTYASQHEAVLLDSLFGDNGCVI